MYSSFYQLVSNTLLALPVTLTLLPTGLWIYVIGSIVALFNRGGRLRAASKHTILVV